MPRAKAIKKLNDKQHKYLLHRLGGKPIKEATTLAGYTADTSPEYHPEIQRRIVEERNNQELEARYTRAEAIADLRSAIDIAREKGDPAGIVRGVTELNRMHGYLEPERKSVTYNHMHTAILKKLEGMSDDDLRDLAIDSGTLIEHDKGKGNG